MSYKIFITRSVPLVALVLGIAVTAPTDGALITFASGNTNPGDVEAPPFTGVLDATVNFAIFARDDLDPSDPYGTGFTNFGTVSSGAGMFVPGGGGSGPSSTSFNTTSSYLYLYQIVNDGTGDLAASEWRLGLPFGVTTPDVILTSWGHFVDVGLRDLEGTTDTEVSATNVFGPNASPATDHSTPPGSVDPANLGVVPPSDGNVVVSITDAVEPSATSAAPPFASATFVATFSPRLDQLQRSSLIGFTSDLPPFLVNTAVIEGGVTADGLAISPTNDPVNAPSILVPEPASLVIWGFGAFGLVLFGLRRRKVVSTI